MAEDKNYLRATLATKDVGRNIAMVIDHMVSRRNGNLRDIHLIGHSLGAHIAGFAGMFLRKEKGKKISRITGLGKNNFPILSAYLEVNDLVYFRPSISRFYSA